MNGVWGIDFLDIPSSATLAPSPAMKKPPRHDDLLRQPFVQAILDPTVIRGIYNTCDQWCLYCPATSRCLAYRCRPDGAADQDPQEIYSNIAARMEEGMKLLRAVNAAEGRTIPELEALLDGHLQTPPTWTPVDDPLERLARRYARVSSSYLVSHPEFPFAMKYRPMGPTSFEVFAWYHVLIAVKIYRAISGSAAAARGERELRRDALLSAKTALIGIDRSRAALQALQKADDDVRLPHMEAQLRRMARELEARFPEARSMVRPGLDPEPACAR
ncbi:MAG TPA: hypothetical protein VJ813_21135 [Vicinamibacterales bacterium]|nr:hypothetical protein [Vicinamibacterales bacterium]